MCNRSQTSIRRKQHPRSVWKEEKKKEEEVEKKEEEEEEEEKEEEEEEEEKQNLSALHSLTQHSETNTLSLHRSLFCLSPLSLLPRGAAILSNRP